MWKRNESVYEFHYFIQISFINYDEKRTFPEALVRILHPAAVALILNAVGSGGSTEEFQAVGGVIVDGVYSASEAREESLSATRGTSYLQINEQK